MGKHDFYEVHRSPTVSSSFFSIPVQVVSKQSLWESGIKKHATERKRMKRLVGKISEDTEETTKGKRQVVESNHFTNHWYLIELSRALYDRLL